MRILGALAGFSLLAGCNGSAPRSSPSSSDTPGPSHDASWVTVTAADASSPGDSSTYALDTDATLGPDPPLTPCTTIEPVCPSPPPACVDSHVAVRYGGGQCDGGFCTWEKNELDCHEVDASCVGAAGIDGSPGGLGDAVADGSVWVNISGCLLIAPSAPTPSPLACDVDASPDGGLCPIPPSSCADRSWLVYYDDGQCVAGLCAWQKKEIFCSIGCQNGGCVSRGTPPPPPLPTAPN